MVPNRDQQFADNQHPSFKNWVDLQDRQMKDGDVSLILNNVTINDAGTYKCRLIQTGTSGQTLITIIYLHVDPPGTSGLTLINTTYLHVVPPGQTGGDTEDGSVGLIVGLIVFALLVVVAAAVVGFLIYRKHEKTKSQDPYHQPAELQPV
ncbi:unnamed protein product [Oreochromis niloticus]|nr:unnamed protein product [Mustela putorius furo]